MINSQNEFRQNSSGGGFRNILWGLPPQVIRWSAVHQASAAWLQINTSLKTAGQSNCNHSTDETAYRRNMVSHLNTPGWRTTLFQANSADKLVSTVDGTEWEVATPASCRHAPSAATSKPRLTMQTGASATTKQCPTNDITLTYPKPTNATTR